MFYSRDESFFDYKRALLYYANGFRDNHVTIDFEVDATRRLWPEFLPVAEDRKLRVTLSQNPDVPVGSIIQSCDG